MDLEEDFENLQRIAGLNVLLSDISTVTRKDFIISKSLDWWP